jgi:hypothetical protein
MHGQSTTGGKKRRTEENEVREAKFESKWRLRSSLLSPRSHRIHGHFLSVSILRNSVLVVASSPAILSRGDDHKHKVMDNSGHFGAV